MNKAKNLSAKYEPTNITPLNQGVLQRQCACGNRTYGEGECEECKKKREGKLQRAAINDSVIEEGPEIVHDVLRSSGQPLDGETREFMESHFNHDFSSVRVHTDGRASESAHTVNALAYTVGRDVVFGSGQYAPETHTGRKLLAHELTHVVQQSGYTYKDNSVLRLGSINDSSERVATETARSSIQINIPTGLTYGSTRFQGVIQRQTAIPPDPDCEDLLTQIIARLVELKERADALRRNPLNLPQSGPMSIEGHQQQFRNKQTNLRRMLQQWDTNFCGPYLPDGVWEWATQPTPRPVISSGPSNRVPIAVGGDGFEYRRPREGREISGEDVAKAAGGVAAGYIAYRVIRFLPSLLPPLWWTIPENAAIP